jgi:hypothetical protein
MQWLQVVLTVPVGWCANNTLLSAVIIVMKNDYLGELLEMCTFYFQHWTSWLNCEYAKQSTQYTCITRNRKSIVLSNGAVNTTLLLLLLLLLLCYKNIVVLTAPFESTFKRHDGIHTLKENQSFRINQIRLQTKRLKSSIPLIQLAHWQGEV